MNRERVVPLRGNVNTRLAKLDAGDYDAIILASAGLKRLGMTKRITQSLDTDVSLPAIGQGAIGIECRTDDLEINKILSALHDTETGLCVSAERAMNARLNGGCQVPIAGFAQLQDGQIVMRGLVGNPDGSVLYRSQRSGGLDQGEVIGRWIAEDLLAQGADEILQALFH
jgi:hydroxymethylbilane synthase